MSPGKLLTRFPTRRLVSLACVLGIVALLLMCWSVLFQEALAVVLGMGLGHALGILAFLLYALAVVGDIYRGDVDEVLPPSARPDATEAAIEPETDEGSAEPSDG